MLRRRVEEKEQTSTCARVTPGRYASNEASFNFFNPTEMFASYHILLSPLRESPTSDKSRPRHRALLRALTRDRRRAACLWQIGKGNCEVFERYASAPPSPPSFFSSVVIGLLFTPPLLHVPILSVFYNELPILMLHSLPSILRSLCFGSEYLLLFSSCQTFLLWFSSFCFFALHRSVIELIVTKRCLKWNRKYF